MKPKVSIIFPTFNGWEDTKECLASISKLNYPKDKLEVIIVDNASSDATVKMAKKWGENIKGFKLIENKENFGFAKAVNQGARKAKSELLLITNNDISFLKNCLRQLVKTLINNPSAGAVGGRVFWKKSNRFCVDGFRLNPYLGYHQFDLTGTNRQRECDWISGHCFLIKRGLFLDLGGFDESYFFYFEDVDFCLRLKKAGFNLLYCPSAIAYHGYAKTVYKEKVSKILDLGCQSRWRCVFKNANLLQIITSSVFLLSFVPLYQSFKTRNNVYLSMLKGLSFNLTNLKQIKKLRNES